MATRFDPVSSDERLRTLDVLRGAALLGMVLMNIVFTGLPVCRLLGIRICGVATIRSTSACWPVQWVLFDGKMRALFSMMFGAGDRAFHGACAGAGEQRGARRICSRRRMLWLMAVRWRSTDGFFGRGDILYSYGLFGLLIVPMRNVGAAQIAHHRWRGTDAAVVGRRGSGGSFSARHARRGGGGARRRGAGTDTDYGAAGRGRNQ